MTAAKEQDIVLHFEGGVSPDVLAALAEATPADEIDWRPDRATWQHRDACPGKQCRDTRDPDKHVQLAYVDARYVMDRLDAVVGRANWSRKHLIGTDGKVACGIGILVQGVGWVERWDGAGATAIEGDKGSFSDAFKRAAVSWGVARDLYSLDKTPPQQSSQGGPFTPEVVSSPTRVEQQRVVDDWAQEAAAETTAEQSGPSCPDHGTRSLKPSKFGVGQFYCSGKGGRAPNPKGYCTWSTNPRAA